MPDKKNILMFERLRGVFKKKEPGVVTVDIHRSAIVELATMLNVQNYNLGVFLETPAYKTDEFALKYMIKSNIVMVSYLMNVFDIDPEEIVANLKREQDEGFIQSNPQPHPSMIEKMEKEKEKEESKEPKTIYDPKINVEFG